MVEPIIVPTFLSLLQIFSESFTGPSFETFRHLMGGWILCIGRHTTTGVMEAAGVVGYKHHTSFHRFFRTARWAPDNLGIALLYLLIRLVPEDQPITFAVDDTLARHTGKRISSAGMHRDPLLSTATKPFFHFGHVWVVLALVVKVPHWNKTFALPVLARLYRSEQVCKKTKMKHRKKTELALELTGLIRQALPAYKFVIVGDNAFANRTVLKGLPSNSTFVGRGLLNAALFQRPWARRPGERGRARVRGKRLPSPGQRAANPKTKWKLQKVDIYGKPARVKVIVFDALWQKRGPGTFLRFVVIRGWPGHAKDDVLICTDTTMSPRSIIETFCLRWSIEVTFHWCKSKLGLEESQNRTERAVQRTAPMALWSYSLVVYWYLTVGKRACGAMRDVPWYKTKKSPAFSDMLAALRRETWRRRIFDRAGNTRVINNSIKPLLAAVGYV